MGLFIGMDEAGYGPNLGPLVITATAWELPAHPVEFDLWELFAETLTAKPAKNDSRLHIADSKQVYSPAKGIGKLERGVRATLGLLAANSDDYRGLCEFLCDDSAETFANEPCLRNRRLSLPIKPTNAAWNLARIVTAWQTFCATHGIRLRAIRSEIIWPARWNRLLKEHGNKACALTTVSLRLLRSQWNPADAEPTLIIGDKHGGRNAYGDFLREIVDGVEIEPLEESSLISRYRVGGSELRFQQGGEAHLPVAVASLVSKYIRELSMDLFNAFWTEHMPGLKPTKGYPQDAKRFRSDIAAAQERLGIPDSVLWRAR